LRNNRWRQIAEAVGHHLLRGYLHIEAVQHRLYVYARLLR
jgi:hypothetical protein